jgi:AhpD family alkylhydroperoxidase
MSHIAPLADAQAGAAKPLFDAVQGKFRMVPNVFRTMGHAPEVLRHTLGLDEAIGHDLDPKLRELAYLKASQVNGCGYCEHYHRGAAKAAGVSDAQVQGLGLPTDGGPYSEVERLVVRFAEQWTRQGKADADTVTALGRHLSPKQLVTLAAVVGLANWTNRFNETFAVELP